MKTRKTYKKFLLFVPIIAVFALFAAACNHSDDDVSTATTAKPGIKVGLVYDIGGRGDQSFNDSAFAGVERAGNELNTDYKEVSPNSDGSNRAELINLQAENQDLVIGVGFLYGDSILEAAKASPNVKFAIVDSSVPAEDPPSNLAGLVFAEHEGSFLVGVAAGLKTKSEKIGFIGGVTIDLIKKFEAGFVAGVKAVNANATVDVRYISEFPDFSGFGDPAKAKVIANDLYSKGNDVIYHAAGGSGAGLFEAAFEYSVMMRTQGEAGFKVWAIGVDSDQYNLVDREQREFVLTSMLKRVDVAVYSTIKDATDGNFKGGVNSVYDLETDGVGYSTTGGFVDDIVDQLEDYKQRIIAGTITVPTTP